MGEKSKLIARVAIIFSLCVAAYAQDGAEIKAALEADCRDGDHLACAKIRAFENFISNRENNAQETVDDSGAQDIPANFEQDQIIDTIPEVSSEKTGWFSWKRLGIFFVVWIFGRAFFRVLKERKQAKADQEKFSQLELEPALTRPPLKNGPRNMQGVLLGMNTNEIPVAQWDKTFINQWLNNQLAKIRPLITDPKIFELANEFIIDDESGIRRTKAGIYATAKFDTEDKEINDLMKIPEYAYVAYSSVSKGVAGSGYLIGFYLANAPDFKDASDETKRAAFECYRFSADQDFQPAIINMCAIFSEDELWKRNYCPPSIIEAYYRQAFDLGASDGHFHVCVGLQGFYADFPNRPDHGYVAAAYQRLKTYQFDEASPDEYFEYYSRIFNEEETKRELTKTTISIMGKIRDERSLENDERTLH